MLRYPGLYYSFCETGASGSGDNKRAGDSTGTGSAMQQWAVFLSPLAGLAGYTLAVWHHRDSAVSLTGVNAL